MNSKNTSTKWFKSAFGVEESSSSPLKKLKLATESEKNLSQTKSIDLTLEDDEQFSSPFTTNIDVSSTNWMESFAPKKVSDLGVHAKKIEEVQHWLNEYEKNKQKRSILLVTGPSGCGKTATIKLVATERNYEICEWITPLDLELMRFSKFEMNDGDTFQESQIEKFNQFLFKASRYNSVFDSFRQRLLLVEDFPNVLIKDVELFSDILQRYTEYGKSPLVFIATESSNKQLNFAKNLFPDNVRAKFNISHISFNSISSTLMKKGLNRIAAVISQDIFSKFYKQPTTDTIESIILASQGDIRSAIINLHFLSQKNSAKPQVEMIKTSQTKNLKKRENNKKLKNVGRDETISLMHALGRVFNPKYHENAVNTKKNELTFIHSPEEITESFSSQPANFFSFLQANYLNRFDNIEDSINAANTLSSCDVFMNEWRDDALRTLGLNVAIRGLMVYNQNPSQGWIPVKGPKKLYNAQNDLANEINELNYYGLLSSNIFASDMRTYVNIIKMERSSIIDEQQQSQI